MKKQFNKSKKCRFHEDRWYIVTRVDSRNPLGFIRGSDLDAYITRYKKEINQRFSNNSFVRWATHFYWKDNKLCYEYKVQYTKEELKNFIGADPDRDYDEYWSDRYDKWCDNSNQAIVFTETENLGKG